VLVCSVVNKDPRAPILYIARYGVVDDIIEFAPELFEKIKQKSIWNIKPA